MQIQGFSELSNIFENSKRRFEKEAKNYLQRVGVKFIRRVKILTPVDTGRLRRGWNMEEGHFRVVIDNKVEYGPHVEHGHRTKNGSFVEGRYMLNKTVEEIEKDLEDEFEILIDNLWG